MTKLSPKAVRFVDTAVIKSERDEIRAVWNAFKRDPSKELSEEVARAVLDALQQAERHLRSRLESSALVEDEAADFSNDLGFICTIKRDLASAGLRGRNRDKRRSAGNAGTLGGCYCLRRPRPRG